MHIPANLTAGEFEDHVRRWLLAAGPVLQDFQVTRLETIEGSSGEYEIDVVVKMTVLGGAKLIVLVECKHHRNPIKREVIMVLESKLRDAKAHKGMVFSTARFQAGALAFAAAHNIATLQVTDGGAAYMTRSFGDSIPRATAGSAVAWICELSDTGQRFSIVSEQYGERLRDWLVEPVPQPAQKD